MKMKKENALIEQSTPANKKLWEALSNIDDKFKTIKVVDGVPLTYVHPHRGRELLTELFGPEGTGWRRELLNKEDKGDYISMFMQLHYKISLLSLGAPDEWASICEFGSAVKRYQDPVTRQTINEVDAEKKAYTNAFSRCLTALGYASEIFLDRAPLDPASPHGEAAPGTKDDKIAPTGDNRGNESSAPAPNKTELPPSNDQATLNQQYAGFFKERILPFVPSFEGVKRAWAVTPERHIAVYFMVDAGNGGPVIDALSKAQYYPSTYKGQPVMMIEYLTQEESQAA